MSYITPNVKTCAERLIDKKYHRRPQYRFVFVPYYEWNRSWFSLISASNTLKQPQTLQPASLDNANWFRPFTLQDIRTGQILLKDDEAVIFICNSHKFLSCHSLPEEIIVGSGIFCVCVSQNTQPLVTFSWYQPAEHNCNDVMYANFLQIFMAVLQINIRYGERIRWEGISTTTPL